MDGSGMQNAGHGKHLERNRSFLIAGLNNGTDEVPTPLLIYLIALAQLLDLFSPIPRGGLQGKLHNVLEEVNLLLMKRFSPPLPGG
jgi:hypothetical protein